MSRCARILVVAALLGACTGTEPDGGNRRVGSERAIVIASLDFSESRIVAEAYALALDDAGFPVRRLPNVASREIIEPALEQGFVDFVPEYQGTALSFLTLNQIIGSPRPQKTQLMLAREFGLRAVDVLDFAPGENKNEVVVTRETAERLDLQEISDLRKHAADLVFGGPPECQARPLCLVGLKQEYGLDFRDFQPLDVGGVLTVAALEGGEVDVALLFSTNPEIANKGFVVLEDDRHLQPSEHLVPVVRREVIQAHGPAFARVVNRVSARFTTAVLRQLNGEVEIEGETPATAAREWLAEEGLLR
jgi:osmoprotectant transport system substrate-binding protein